MLFATAARRAGAAVGLAVAHYATNGARDVARSEAAPAALRFGLVTDIQYCDVDDAQNYGGTETRFYRGSLEGAKRAADGFREAKSDGGLAFVAQLGAARRPSLRSAFGRHVLCSSRTSRRKFGDVWGRPDFRGADSPFEYPRRGRGVAAISTEYPRRGHGVVATRLRLIRAAKCTQGRQRARGPGLQTRRRR